MLVAQRAIGFNWKKILKITFGTLCAAVLVTCAGQRSQRSLSPYAQGASQDNPSYLQVQTHQPAVGRLDIGNLGSFSKWSKIEIDLSGPETDALSNNPNPFTIPVDVHFISPNGQTFVVPAFYNGDGSGGLKGNQWKVRFSADATGGWSFSTVSSEPLLNGITGTFAVTPPTGCGSNSLTDLPNFFCMGRLEYAGSYFLRFSNGDYWLKGGIDDPENFLGTAFGDWDSKKTAVDLLSATGVNSIYVITNNIDGDRKDTWPWLGDTQSTAKANNDRFDLVRLEKWEDFFSYVQDKGITLHVVLNDDSAWHNYDHDLYYREMIARFGHHPAIIWNIGEEANEIYTDAQQVALAGKLQVMDPYNHPITVHRKAVWPFLGNINFDLTSIQAGNGAADFSTAKLANYYRIVTDHRDGSAAKGHPIPIMIDETPRVTLINDMTRLKMRSKVLYPIYLAGGNYEMHFYDAYGQAGSLSIEDLSPMLEDMRRARQFVETLPFFDMKPCEDLLTSSSTNYCFGKPGFVYAFYMSEGGSLSVDLTNVFGTYGLQWFNPRTGERIIAGSTAGGVLRTFTAPDNRDWALRLTRSNPPSYDFALYLPQIQR